MGRNGERRLRSRVKSPGDGTEVTKEAIWKTLHLLATWSEEDRKRFIIHGDTPENFNDKEYLAKSRGELRALAKVGRTTQEIQAYVGGNML